MSPPDDAAHRPRAPTPGRRSGPTRGRAPRPGAGQATVELALVLPLVAVLLLSIVQAAVLARDQILVTHAAREAVRAAAVDPDPAAARRAAEQAGPLSADRLRVEVVGRGEVGSRVKVTVSYRAPTAVPLAGAFVDDVVLDAGATMRVER
ncbi:MAG TPA: TadE/TadG family type IV pilus assembly protein [Acidimicrobiales bacterium]|nr:TadE/TadG family type IV pilus assembly protein [Acidimicrobiales bacterium]